MWLLREKLSDFGVKQILYRVDIAFYVHLKNSLRSHLRAIMALDHSRYIRRGKQILGKQIRTNFLRSTSLQILANKSGCVQTILLFFLYTTSEEKEYYEVLFLSYRPRTKCSIWQILKPNCIHSILRTIEARVDF